MKYFTADEHYFHKNVIRYCSRPFENIVKMHDVFIKNHNILVKEEDEVFHIGDFVAMEKNTDKIRNILNRLNGTHHLILGNHDEVKPFSYVECGFMSVHTSLIIQTIEVDFVLNHDPSVCCLLGDRHFLLCGHVHNLFRRIEGKRILNVGVDVNDFKPISLTEIEEEIRK